MQWKGKLLKKTGYNELLKKVNVIDTRKLFDKTDYNAKIKDIEDKIPSFTNLTANSALTALKTRYQTLVI